MGLALIYDSFSDTALFSGGDWTLPLTNMKRDDIGRVARSASLDTDDTQFAVDLGVVRSVGGIIIGPVNVGPGATAVIKAFSDAALTTQVYTSGTLTGTAVGVDWADTDDWLPWESPDFWLGIKEADPEVEALPFYFDHLVPTASTGSATARYWKVEINDPGNPTGHVDIGRCIFGRAYRPAHNYGYGGNETAVKWTTDQRETLAGRKTFWARFKRRSVRFAWEYLPETEAFDTWFRLAARTGLHTQVYVIPEEADTGALRRKRAFLATLTEAPPIQQVIFEHATLALSAEEVI